MATQETEADTTPAIVEGTAEPAPPKKKGKKGMILAAVGALLVLGAGGGGYLMLAGEGAQQEQAGADAPVDATKLVDVPPMTVNLRSADGQARFLKIHLMLLAGTAAPEEVTAKLPLVIDAYQPFLRELRPEDLAGSAATFRLKEEMLIRANTVIGAGAVRDVLIQDLIQQ